MEDRILDELKKINQKLLNLEMQLNAIKIFLVQAPMLKDPNACIDEFGHDYPNPWFGTIPPLCKKCGKQSNTPFITYATDTTNAAGFDFNQFGGNMMFSKENIIDNHTTKDNIIQDDIDNEEDDLITSYGR